MYKELSILEKPDDEIKIWRYVDFTKCVSLFDKKALFFAKAEKLSDPFEGSISKLSLENREQFVRSFPELIDDPESAVKSMQQVPKNSRKFMYLNCWHINSYQSAAMWKLFVSGNEGIAIQSTFGGLRKSLSKCEEDVYIGKVKYVDFEKDFVPYSNVIGTFFHKRISFAYENELRAAIMRLPATDKGDDGIYVPVDLQQLVDSIFISPSSPSWFRDVVASIAKKYHIGASITQSDLGSSPLY